MPRIVVAGGSEQSRGQLARLLASAGFQVFRGCASGNEVRRATNECGDGIVVVIHGLNDCTVDDLAWDIKDRAQTLLIARPPVLDRCEYPGLFRLEMPCQGSEIIGAVEMLSQLHRMRLPKRTGEEKDLVNQAKQTLMARERITEAEAHRRMQRYAMNHGMKMTDYAAQIVQASRETEGS